MPEMLSEMNITEERVLEVETDLQTTSAELVALKEELVRLAERVDILQEAQNKA